MGVLDQVIAEVEAERRRVAVADGHVPAKVTPPALSGGATGAYRRKETAEGIEYKIAPASGSGFLVFLLGLVLALSILAALSGAPAAIIVAIACAFGLVKLLGRPDQRILLTPKELRTDTGLSLTRVGLLDISVRDPLAASGDTILFGPAVAVAPIAIGAALGEERLARKVAVTVRHHGSSDRVVVAENLTTDVARCLAQDLGHDLWPAEEVTPGAATGGGNAAADTSGANTALTEALTLLQQSLALGAEVSVSRNASAADPCYTWKYTAPGSSTSGSEGSPVTAAAALSSAIRVRRAAT